MPTHVAILKRPYLRMILDGRKTVESRLTKTVQPPFGSIAPGERIFLKVSAGPFMATALAGNIDQHDKLTPSDIDRLRMRYDHAVCGNEDYWQAKRDSRYAVFVELTAVEPIRVGPTYPKSMRAWHVIDDQLNPVREVMLTAGAIRNRYLSLPSVSPAMREQDVILLMPDGQEVVTGFATGKPMLRWRGWGAYYRAHDMQPGDTVRIVSLGDGRYRVTFHKQPYPDAMNSH